MINDKADKVLKKLFGLRLFKYQNNLYKIQNNQKSSVFQQKDNSFIFDCVNLFYYRWHKVSLNHGFSHLDKKPKTQQ